MTTTTYSKALESFLTSDEFAEVVIFSTHAGFGGGSYSVELWDNGTYRVLPSGSIGNRYDSQGIIMRVPQISDEDYQAFEEMSLSDGTDLRLIAAQLASTDELEECAKEMRDSLKEGE